MRFCAYIVRESDGEFAGEVNIYRNEEDSWYEMGIALEAKNRGKGYAVTALQLLLQYAFEKWVQKAIHHTVSEISKMNPIVLAAGELAGNK